MLKQRQHALGNPEFLLFNLWTYSSCQAWLWGPEAGGHQKMHPILLTGSLGKTSPPSWLRKEMHSNGRSVKRERNTEKQQCITAPFYTVNVILFLFLSVCTCESSYRPGIDNNVFELKSQLVHCELNHYIHGVGLILGKRHSLAEWHK